MFSNYQWYTKHTTNHFAPRDLESLKGIPWESVVECPDGLAENETAVYMVTMKLYQLRYKEGRTVAKIKDMFGITDSRINWYICQYPYSPYSKLV